jgi:aspartate kinase
LPWEDLVIDAPLTVVKYGGAALGSEESFAAVVRDLREGSRPRVVVVSAREGITDLLKSTVADRLSSARAAAVLKEIERHHPGLPPSGAHVVEELERRLHRLVQASARTGGRTSPRGALAGPPTVDAVLALGERLAAHWVSEQLRRVGLEAEAFEADRIGLRTDGHHGDARVILPFSERSVRRALLPVARRGVLPVVTGFLGRGPTGAVTTLGRGGSDYTATSLGYLLSAARVELVKKDVSILTADPRAVPSARPLSRLSYEEAEELAQFGAKVLHPQTVEPARARGVEVVIRSLTASEQRTTIGPALPGQGIRALTLLPSTAILLLRVPGGRQKRGVIAEVSRALARAQVNVVTLFTSSALLIVVVEGAMGRKARRTLEPFARSVGSSLEGPVASALVTAIGEGVVGDLVGLPNEVASCALGVSATSRTLSFAVPEARAQEALVSLHRALVEARPGARPPVSALAPPA